MWYMEEQEMDNKPSVCGNTTRYYETHTIFRCDSFDDALGSIEYWKDYNDRNFPERKMAYKIWEDKEDVVFEGDV